MNARQRRKLENIKLDPWPAMRRGKAWHDHREAWVTLYPEHPEIAWLIRRAESRHIVQAALKQGKAHRIKRDTQIQDALYRRQALGSDRWLESILQNADFYAGYPPVVVKRIRDGREVLE